MGVSIEQIKELREKTGAGVLDCRNALEQNDGNFDAALEYLREKGLLAAKKREERVAAEGMIEVYSHGKGRVGVMVEVNCETDLVARSTKFAEFAHELALQIAASDPKYISPDDVPADVIEERREQARKLAESEGKPEAIIERIVDGRLNKFLDEVCLLRQTYVRDDKLTVEKLLHQVISALGENIIVRRFERWETGELSEEAEE